MSIAFVKGTKIHVYIYIHVPQHTTTELSMLRWYHANTLQVTYDRTVFAQGQGIHLP